MAGGLCPFGGGAAGVPCGSGFGFYLPELADFESISLVNFVLLSKFLYNALWLMQ